MYIERSFQFAKRPVRQSSGGTGIEDLHKNLPKIMRKQPPLTSDRQPVVHSSDGNSRTREGNRRRGNPEQRG